MSLTCKSLKKALNYSRETGIFTWRTSGCVAGTHCKGYVRILVKGKTYRAHRLAWFYVYGKFPDGQLDHINGVRDDNRLVNLREASHGENSRNRKRPSNNTSGYMGVSRVGKKWKAAIGFDGIYIHLGCYDSAEKASKVYEAKSAELFRGFKRKL